MKAATVYGGLAVTIGSRVVYPGRQGSRLWLNEGVVEDIVTDKDWRDREITKLKVRRPVENWKTIDGKYQKVNGERVVTLTELDMVIPFNG